ncbi:MAG TPA: DUF3099 domain-containing protein [Actinomycetes bacterium]
MARRTGRVYRITAARTALSEDVDDRARRYLFSMLVRTGCFVGAVLASGPLRWLLIAGAVLLPYLSVVFANGGREPGRDEDLKTTVLQAERKQIGPTAPPA